MGDRICLLDQIRNKEIDFDKTIKLVINILQEPYYQLNNFFVKSKYCILGKDLEDAINSIVKRRDNGLNEFLNFFELIDSLIYLYKTNGYCGDAEVDQIEKILVFNLEKTGWFSDYNYETQQFLLKRKDLKAEVVANNTSKDVQTKIYQYLTFRDGMVKEKRETLKSLIDDVDLFCKENANNDFIKKAKHFYQCVRHPKDDPVKEFPFYYRNEEKWLDHIFQMILDILSYKDLKERIKTIVCQESNKESD